MKTPKKRSPKSPLIAFFTRDSILPSGMGNKGQPHPLQMLGGVKILERIVLDILEERNLTETEANAIIRLAIMLSHIGGSQKMLPLAVKVAPMAARVKAISLFRTLCLLSRLDVIVELAKSMEPINNHDFAATLVGKYIKNYRGRISAELVVEDAGVIESVLCCFSDNQSPRTRHAGKVDKARVVLARFVQSVVRPDIPEHIRQKIETRLTLVASGQAIRDLVGLAIGRAANDE